MSLGWASEQLLAGSILLLLSLKTTQPLEGGDSLSVYFFPSPILFCLSFYMGKTIPGKIEISVVGKGMTKRPLLRKKGNRATSPRLSLTLVLAPATLTKNVLRLPSRTHHHYHHNVVGGKRRVILRSST